MTWIIATTASDAPLHPPRPDALVRAFVDELAKLAQGGMTAADNPQYLAVVAREQVAAILHLLDEAHDQVLQGNLEARAIAHSYRGVYSLFRTIDTLASDHRYGDLKTLLELGYFGGKSEAELRSLCQDLAPSSQAHNQLATTPVETLRHYLLEQQLKAHPEIAEHFRWRNVGFDRELQRRQLFSFSDSIRTSPHITMASLANHAGKAAAATLAVSTAGSYAGLISPELALAVAGIAAAASSGGFVIEHLPDLSAEHQHQLRFGLEQISAAAAELEKAAAKQAIRSV